MRNLAIEIAYFLKHLYGLINIKGVIASHGKHKSMIFLKEKSN